MCRPEVSVSTATGALPMSGSWEGSIYSPCLRDTGNHGCVGVSSSCDCRHSRASRNVSEARPQTVHLLAADTFPMCRTASRWGDVPRAGLLLSSARAACSVLSFISAPVWYHFSRNKHYRTCVRAPARTPTCVTFPGWYQWYQLLNLLLRFLINPVRKGVLCLPTGR